MMVDFLPGLLLHKAKASYPESVGYLTQGNIGREWGDRSSGLAWSDKWITARFAAGATIHSTLWTYTPFIWVLQQMQTM